MYDDDPYTISDTQKMQFAGIYLLEYMQSKEKTFPILLRSEEQDLESILEWLLVRKLVEIKDQREYVVTDHGRAALKKFATRYQDYLHNFDVFSAVDLAAGEFAFASYFNFETDAEWKDFLSDDRWEDLRVAVADYEDMDPVEIVFMSFLNEGRFGRNASGWQFDLLLGSVWDEILDICNNALDENDLAYDGVPGEDVLRDIVAQGADLMADLLEQEQRREHRRHLPGQNGSTWGGESLRSEQMDFDPRNRPDQDPRPPESRDRWSM